MNTSSLFLICCVGIVDGLYLAQWMYAGYCRSITQYHNLGMRCTLISLAAAGGFSLLWLLVQIILIMVQLLNLLLQPVMPITNNPLDRF